MSRIKPKLQDILPGYMIPSLYIPIRVLPFSNSYKLDRKLLKECADSPKIVEVQKALQHGQTHYKDGILTAAEEVLRGIEGKVLCLEPDTFSTSQDFFDLGGDSLKAIAFVSKARRAGFHFSVAQLYKYRTIAQLSEHSSEAIYDNSQIQSIPLIDATQLERFSKMAILSCGIKADSIQAIMPITDMQRFYLSRQRSRPYCWQVPIAFDLPHDVDIGRLRRSWEAVLARNPITRTRFLDTERGIYQIVLKQDSIQWRPETSLAELLTGIDKVDLSFGHIPHQSALLNATEADPPRLVWFVNHAISDQAMDELLTQELSDLYQDRHLSARKHQSFLGVIHHRMTSDRAASHAYWQSQLGGAKYKPLFEHPMITETMASNRVSCEVKVLAPNWLKVSKYALMMAAWAVSLARFSRVEDIPFFIVRAGRSSDIAGGEDVIGPMLTRAPVRVSIKDDMSIVDFLHSIDSRIENSRDHEIVSEDAFRDICPEAADHLTHGVYINFVPPAFGTLTAESLFKAPHDLKNKMGYADWLFDLDVEVGTEITKLWVLYQEDLLSNETVQCLLKDVQNTLKSLRQFGREETVKSLLAHRTRGILSS
ncbi:hypothetical protein MMC25_007855 [Agyrium rufum]|nr:hypothetical protein [Agyrium rufum]